MRKQIDGNFLVNGWMKHHNTTIEDVFRDHPEYHLDNRQFYLDYSVTQEQYDEWVIWAKEQIKKVTKLSNKTIDHGWSWVYLNTAPHIQQIEN